MDASKFPMLTYHTRNDITATIVTEGGEVLRVAAKRDRRNGRFTPKHVTPLGRIDDEAAA